jgi:hypothetical protein
MSKTKLPEEDKMTVKDAEIAREEGNTFGLFQVDPKAG